MTTTGLIQRYYDSLNQKNDTWQDLWADNAVFSDASRTLNASGRQAVIESFTPFLMGVSGVQVKQLFAQGNNACVVATYDYVNAKGQTLSQDVVEIWEVEDGSLSTLTIYFDLTAYRQFMHG